MDVLTYLENEKKKPFVWGETDCCFRANRWVQIKTGISPLNLSDRVYTNERQAIRWLINMGGMAIAVNRVMRQAGFKRTNKPQAGDVGLIKANSWRLCMAIFDGENWSSRDEKKEIVSSDFVKAWSIK
jgi:hypothetical protein